MNNLDWMAPIEEPEGYDGPQRNLSGSSTVVTNIEASGTYNSQSHLSKGITVETRHVTQYEPACPSPKRFSSFSTQSCALLKSSAYPAEPLARRPSGCPQDLAAALERPHAFLTELTTSSLNEMLAESSAGQAPISPRTPMQPFEEEMDAQ
jgi:hypothetical protein